MASPEQQDQHPDGITLMQESLNIIKAKAAALQEDLMTTFDTGRRFRKTVRKLKHLDRVGTILELAIEKKKEKG